MRKVVEMMTKWNQHGSQNQDKIVKCRKSGLPKSTMKNDTFQEAKKSEAIVS